MSKEETPFSPPTHQQQQQETFRVIWGPQRFKLSIGWKTLIAFALVLLIPMFGLMLLTENTLRNTLETETTRSLEANLRGAWRVYHERMENVRAALLQSASSPTTHEALDTYDTEGLVSMLERHASLMPETDVWLVIDAQQRVVARRNGPIGGKVFFNNLITRSFTFMEAVTSTEIIPNEIFLEENPLRYSSLDVQVMSQLVVVPVQQNGRLLGAMIGLILMNGDSWLPNAIHDYLTIDAALFGSITQESRIIAASSRPNNIWSTGLLAPPSLREHIRTGSIFSGQLNINDTPIYALAEPIENSEGLPIGALAIGVKGANIEALLDRNSRNVYLFVGVGIVLSLLIAFLAYRDTMTPMRAIMGAMDEFARGHMRVRTEIKTKDEFEQLGVGFNRMASSIQEHQERVESFNSLSTLLITSLKPKDLMQKVLDKVIELTHSQAGVIYLREEDGKHDLLNPYVAYAVDVDRMESLKYGEGLPGAVAEKKQAVFVNEIPKECRLNINFGIADMLPNQVAVFPIVYRESTLGVMVLATLNRFRGNELSLLEYMTNQIAVVLENALTHEKVEKLSITDALTGAYNRGYISNRLEEEFANATRYGSPLSVLIIDIDHFKHINDEFGHHVGDQALIAVSGALKGKLRETDRLGRYGGEEFVVILPHTSALDAVSTAEKLRSAIAELQIAGMGSKRVTISIGVAAYPDIPTNSVEDIVRHADQALYEAKETGRNKVVHFTE